MVLIFKLKDPVQRLWYGHQATANGWSRSMLINAGQCQVIFANNAGLCGAFRNSHKKHIPSP
jgi:hypothetical protein